MPTATTIKIGIATLSHRQGRGTSATCSGKNFELSAPTRVCDTAKVATDRGPQPRRNRQTARQANKAPSATDRLLNNAPTTRLPTLL